jgi:hypothetical protein
LSSHQTNRDDIAVVAPRHHARRSGQSSREDRPDERKVEPREPEEDVTVEEALATLADLRPFLDDPSRCWSGRPKS